MRAARILLGPETSERIREAGDVFAVVSPASYPDNPARVVLHLVPSTVERIDLAVQVARGELATRRPSKR